ncbi:MAG: hypothetical protein Alpg2KO_03000 [Alphaproteobacteria bacterium]
MATLTKMMDQMGVHQSMHFLLHNSQFDLPSPDAIIKAWPTRQDDGEPDLEIEEAPDAEGAFTLVAGTNRLMIHSGPGYPPFAEYDLAYDMIKRRGPDVQKAVADTANHGGLVISLVASMPEGLMPDQADPAKADEDPEVRHALNAWKIGAETIAMKVAAICAEMTGATYFFKPSMVQISPAEALVELTAKGTQKDLLTFLTVSTWPSEVDDGGPLIVRTAGLAPLVGHDIEVRAPSGGPNTLEKLLNDAQAVSRYLVGWGAVLLPGQTMGASEDPNHPDNLKAQSYIAPGMRMSGDEDEQVLLITPGNVDIGDVTGTQSHDAGALKNHGQLACSLFFDGTPKLNAKKIMAAWDELNPSRVRELKIEKSVDGFEFPLTLGSAKGSLIKVRKTAFDRTAFKMLAEDAELEAKIMGSKASVGIFLDAAPFAKPSPADDAKAFRRRLDSIADLARLAAAVEAGSQGNSGFLKGGKPTCLATPAGIYTDLGMLQQWGRLTGAPDSIIAQLGFAIVRPLEHEGKWAIAIVGIAGFAGADLLMRTPDTMSEAEKAELLGNPHRLAELVYDSADQLKIGNSLPLPGNEKYKVTLVEEQPSQSPGQAGVTLIFDAEAV